MKCIVACGSLILLSLSTLVASSTQDDESPLQLRIANHRGLIGVGEGDILRDQLFVVVTNVSDAPVRIFDQWNSWGYHNLTFSLERDNPDIKRELMRFGGQVWTGNAPDTIELAPGEHYVFAVTFQQGSNRMLTSSWGPLAVQNGAYPWVTIQAHFEIKADVFSEQQKVWTGKISSPPVRLRLSDETGQRGAKDELTDANTSK
jgi:hypothetical protein